MNTRAYTIYVVPEDFPNKESRKITNCNVDINLVESINNSFGTAEKHLYKFVPEGHFMVKYEDQTKIGV